MTPTLVPPPLPTGRDDTMSSLPASVLVAEDDPMYRRILETALRKWGYQVSVVEDGASAWRELQAHSHPRLILLDWIMPGLDGVEVCRRLRAFQHDAYSYIIVVTSRAAKQDAIAALDAGADDFLTKPVDIGELRARVQVGSRILQLQEELIRSRERLRFQATHDALTGLRNRRSIAQMVREELLRAGRSDESVGVLMLDIDHFKAVNDSYGHAAGDAVLAEVAARIVQAVRVYDKVGRYGGEEFLVVVPGADVEELGCIAERIRGRVAASSVVALSATVAVTVSIGGACTQPCREPDCDALIRVADAAMYRAKSEGRNRCVIGPALDRDTASTCPSAAAMEHSLRSPGA